MKCWSFPQFDRSTKDLGITKPLNTDSQARYFARIESAALVRGLCIDHACMQFEIGTHACSGDKDYQCGHCHILLLTISATA
jgi:hypothetical protein